MLIHKAFRYRVYPTTAQQARLAKWDDALRFLWNLALEQRNLGLSRTDKRYPTAFDQQKEMTELRRQLPWLADVPRDVCSQMLVELDKGFQRCFKRLGRLPRWKRKGKDFMGVCESHAKMWRVDGTAIRFPKLGVLRAVMHRPLDGTPKTCALKRDGDQWFALIVCEIEIADPIQRSDPVLAIDRGITNLLADSDGNLIANPKHYDKSMRRLAHASRAVSRTKKGSKNREKAKVRVMRIHRKVRRQREYFLHCLSSTIAKSNGVVVIEKLNVAGMVRSKLARSIVGAGWSQFANMLRYKLHRSGGTLVEVPAQYSSQTCSACGVVDAASRKAERFFCVACAFVDHADLNAAKVLKHRYETTPGNPWCLPVEGSALEASRRSRKEKVKLRTSRRSLLRVATNLSCE